MYGLHLGKAAAHIQTSHRSQANGNIMSDLASFVIELIQLPLKTTIKIAEQAGRFAHKEAKYYTTIDLSLVVCRLNNAAIVV